MENSGEKKCNQAGNCRQQQGLRRRETPICGSCPPFHEPSSFGDTCAAAGLRGKSYRRRAGKFYLGQVIFQVARGRGKVGRVALRSHTTSQRSSWKGKATAPAPSKLREMIIPLPAPLTEAGMLSSGHHIVPWSTRGSDLVLCRPQNSWACLQTSVPTS